MKQGSFSYFGIANIILSQLLIVIFGVGALLSNPLAAILIGLFTLGGITFVLAGLGLEFAGLNFRQFAAFGYFATAVSFVGLTILGEVWNSPTNIYPKLALIAMLLIGGLMLVRIGFDIATDRQRIVTVEPTHSPE
ncbi:hypothetical protein [Haladaptatus cibarius]|uniref:hypothetical protein n=1 Tax=Haladaptatus cibarius TaxID=453847 RepID=UPI0006799E9A|nr:hypothetical protein [Haladaptatus cibarius]